jgi:hypothetical protein
VKHHETTRNAVKSLMAWPFQRGFKGWKGLLSWAFEGKGAHVQGVARETLMKHRFSQFAGPRRAARAPRGSCGGTSCVTTQGLRRTLDVGRRGPVAELGREVDLVVLDHADDELVHRVLRDGARLRDTDRSARIAFEVAARNRFFDMQPVRQAYRRARARADR